MAFRYTMLLDRENPEAQSEISVMATFFDSFRHNDPGYGIAMVWDGHADRLPDDPWYGFET